MPRPIMVVLALSLASLVAAGCGAEPTTAAGPPQPTPTPPSVPAPVTPTDPAATTYIVHMVRGSDPDLDVALHIGVLRPETVDDTKGCPAEARVAARGVIPIELTLSNPTAQAKELKYAFSLAQAGGEPVKVQFKFDFDRTPCLGAQAPGVGPDSSGTVNLGPYTGNSVDPGKSASFKGMLFVPNLYAPKVDQKAVLSRLFLNLGTRQRDKDDRMTADVKGGPVGYSGIGTIYVPLDGLSSPCGDAFKGKHDMNCQ